MKRIGSTAMGGIMERTPTSGARVARTIGSTPMATPNTSPPKVAKPRPRPSRRRLAPVSVHST